MMLASERDLIRRFSALRDRFCRASDKWPNLQTILITWAEDEPPCDAMVDLPRDLSPQYAVPYPERASDGSIAFAALLIGGCELDSPARRYRAGRAGMIIIRRSFGKFSGDPRKVDDPDEATAIGERFKALAWDGSRHLEQVGEAVGLSKNVLDRQGYTRWVLAVHETVEGRILKLRERYTCEILDDIFLSSAEAINKWVADWSEPAAVSEESTASADSADNPRLFPGGAPDNPDIRDLVAKLDADKGGKKSQNGIAREFTGESVGRDKKARSLLRQVRRLKAAGKVNL